MKNDLFKLYESDLLRQTTGDTLRPGGFYLTDLGVKFCDLPPNARVLDVGCGRGVTVERLVSLYQLQAIGLDPSEVLLENGRKKNPGLNLIRGFGEDLPFLADQMDGIFAECALSVMEDLDQALGEIFRVLKPGGWLVVNDVYARNPDGLESLQELNLNSCIRRALPKKSLINKLTEQGFKIVHWSDHTNLLTQLTVDLIMTHGSMTEFWLKSSSCSGSVDPVLAQSAIKQAKMGYFQMIAQKDTVAVREEQHMKVMDEVLISTTESLCPECLIRIPAQRVVQGEKVYLMKRCPEHGDYRTLLWRGSPQWDLWVRPTIPTPPKECFTQVEKGCPFDCGLCENHYKTTCTALIEVTQRCNLNCRFCFANAGTELDEPSLEVIEGWYKNVLAASGPVNIQLSGGEPTLRNDLPEIIKMGRALGFEFIQLNTNGLRLAEDPIFLYRLKEVGLSSIFLQFDGTEDKIYQSIRGRRLLDVKVKAIESCAQHEIGVVLVPTLIPGINTHNIGEIIKFGLKNHPAVRGVHFQPVSYFGRIPKEPLDQDRITLPEVIQAIEEQTEGLIKATNLKPHNGRCSFSGNFTRQSDGSLKPIVNSSCCTGPERADELARKTRTFVARQWSGVEKLSIQSPSANSWDSLIQQLKTYAFSISGMAFQDVWNLDIDRLRNCCIHVVSPEGKLIPFCIYNLTDKFGHSIYRKER